jgi:hypothetical protein
LPFYDCRKKFKPRVIGYIPACKRYITSTGSVSDQFLTGSGTVIIVKDLDSYSFQHHYICYQIDNRLSYFKSPIVSLEIICIDINKQDFYLLIPVIPNPYNYLTDRNTGRDSAHALTPPPPRPDSVAAIS